MCLLSGYGSYYILKGSEFGGLLLQKNYLKIGIIAVSLVNQSAIMVCNICTHKQDKNLLY